MKNVEIKTFKRVISNMEEYNGFIKDCESEEYNRSLLEQFLLNKQYSYHSHNVESLKGIQHPFLLIDLLILPTFHLQETYDFLYN